MTINVPRPDKNVTCRFKYSDAFNDYENVYRGQHLSLISYLIAEKHN